MAGGVYRLTQPILLDRGPCGEGDRRRTKDLAFGLLVCLCSLAEDEVLKQKFPALEVQVDHKKIGLHQVDYFLR